MAICNPLVPQFIDLCDLPAIDKGLANNSLTIEITPIHVYNYGSTLAATINCKNLKLARAIAQHQNNLMAGLVHLEIAELYIKVNSEIFTLMSNSLFYFGLLNVPKVDINKLFNSPDPVYLIDMNSENLILTNPAGAFANQKTFKEFIGDNIACLAYPDELAKRKQLLRKDGQLINYECKLMRWYNDEQKWRRKEIEVIADVQKIDFWGTECRLAVELMIEETNRFID